VATFVYASSQGQRTHSARTNLFGLNQKCPECSSEMSGILDPRILPFRSSA
jgi:hypothetical protein